MSAALKPVPRPPQRAQSNLSRLESLALRDRPTEPRSNPGGQLTRFPSRAELVHRKQTAIAPQPGRRGTGNIAPTTRGTAKKSLTNRAATVRSLPTTQTVPNWLKLLLVLQHTSGPLALSLVTAALVVYGWTVHVQQIWSNNFHQLERLQQQERNLTTYGQMVNHQIAKQAEAPDTNLALPGPQNTIFLEPPQPLPAPPQLQTVPPIVAPVEVKAPMGY